MVVHKSLGPPVLIGPGDRAMNESTIAGVMNQLNWYQVQRDSSERLVDANASPVLVWLPGKASKRVLYISSIGSYAVAMAAVSPEFEKWVKRAIGWVRRNGTRVWGRELHKVRPDLNLDLPFVNSVYALPGALIALQNGAVGRDCD